jgi:hypothetical protein
MSRRVTGWALILTATFCAVPSLAVGDAALNKDLMTVIALQGLPCGQVVSVKQQGDNDYIASCGDGNRYHVFINAAGRVVAQKQ